MQAISERISPWPKDFFMIDLNRNHATLRGRDCLPTFCSAVDTIRIRHNVACVAVCHQLWQVTWIDFFTFYFLEKPMKFRRNLQINDRQRKRRIRPKLASFKTAWSSACLANFKLAADKLPWLKEIHLFLLDERREGTSARNRPILYHACVF